MTASSFMSSAELAVSQSDRRLPGRVTAYKSSLARIYLGKAEEVLPTLGRESVDLIVMDPPYGVSYRSNRGQNFPDIANDDGTLDIDGILAAALRTLRSARHIYQFGGLGFGDDAAIGGRCELIWDKETIGMGDLTVPWGPQHEIIDFGVYISRPSNRARGDGRLSARLRAGSVLRVLRPNSASIKRHPTEKPVALLRQLIESSSCVGETVLDPFLGCGSTAVAAVLSGRRFVGCELDPGYAAIAVARVVEAERVVRMMEGV